MPIAGGRVQSSKKTSGGNPHVHGEFALALSGPQSVG